MSVKSVTHQEVHWYWNNIQVLEHHSRTITITALYNQFYPTHFEAYSTPGSQSLYCHMPLERARQCQITYEKDQPEIQK